MNALQTILVGIACGAGLGVTMKVADLLNEHGLKWFKGSSTLFGVLWGGFGALLVLLDAEVATIAVAMTVAFIPRGRLDYFNHQLAGAIIIVTFILTRSAEPVLFIIFLAAFLLFGGLKDFVDDVLRRQGILKRLTEWMLYYPVPTFIFGLVTHHWLPFWIFLIYTLAYNSTKAVAKRRGYQ
jgi:hypothetical protein